MSRSRDFNGLSLEQSVRLAETTDSMAVLDELLDHPHPWVRRAVVRNSHIRSESLHRLAKDPDHEIRACLARHRLALPIVLKDLAKDADWRIRMAVAQSPRASVATLVELAGDRVVEVRRAVARNRQMPTSALAGISAIEDAILARILEKRRSSELFEQGKMEVLSLLDRACESKDAESIQVLVTRMENLGGGGLFAKFLRTKAISPEMVRLFAAHSDVRARRLIAGQLHIDPTTMALLASDCDVEVRCKLASNWSIDRRSMDILRKDAAKEVRKRLSQNLVYRNNVLRRFNGRHRKTILTYDRAIIDVVSAELQILVLIGGIGASWLIYFLIRWL